MSDVQPAPVPCPDHAGDALDTMKERNSLSAEGIASISGHNFPADMTQPEFRQTSVLVEAHPERSEPQIGNSSQGKQVYFKSVLEPTPTKTLLGVTDTAIFMAQAVLHAVSSGQPIAGTTEHDLESFCWVIIYVIYKHALDDTETLQIIAEESAHEDFRDSLAKEFRALFAAFSISDLIGRRETLWGNHNLLAGIPNLLAYAVHVKDDGEDMEGIVMAIWIEIQNFQPPKFLPERGLPKYRASILARTPRAVKVGQNKSAHDIILDHLKVVLHEVEEHRIMEEARNAARTAREMHVE